MTTSMIRRRIRVGDPDAPSRRHTLMLAAAAGGSIALLSALVARLDVDEAWPVDHVIRRAMSRRKAPRARAALRVVERAGTVAVYAPLTVLSISLLARRNGMRRALPIGVAVAGSGALGLLLKYLVRRPRPGGGAAPPNTHPSFPSGHTTRATALSGILAYVAVRERLAAHVEAAALATTVAVGTGVARASADAHWTTDVVGGWAAGATSMAAAALLYEHYRGEEHR